MKSRTASLLLVIAGFLLAGMVAAGPVAGASALLNVFVTNDSAHPVPVREQNVDANGLIRVHEQGTANVAVQGTPSVSIQGTPTVSVNDPEAAHQPWRQTFTLDTEGVPYYVPAGKLLVIENVSVNGGAITPSWTVTIQDIGSGFGGTRITVVGTKLASCEFSGNDCYAANEQVHVYAAHGDRIFVDATNSPGYTLDLSGYLIDA